MYLDWVFAITLYVNAAPAVETQTVEFKEYRFESKERCMSQRQTALTELNGYNLSYKISQCYALLEKYPQMKK